VTLKAHTRHFIHPDGEYPQKPAYQWDKIFIDASNTPNTYMILIVPPE